MTLDLSLEQAWVAYVALAERAERAVRDDRDPTRERRLVERIEADRYRFAPPELDLLCEALDAHLADAPARDRPACRAVIGAIRAATA